MWGPIVATGGVRGKTHGVFKTHHRSLQCAGRAPTGSTGGRRAIILWALVVFRCWAVPTRSFENDTRRGNDPLECWLMTSRAFREGGVRDLLRSFETVATVVAGIIIGRHGRNSPLLCAGLCVQWGNGSVIQVRAPENHPALPTSMGGDAAILHELCKIAVSQRDFQGRTQAFSHIIRFSTQRR